MHLLLRHVLDSEYAGKHEIEAEQHAAGSVGLAFKLELDLDVGFPKRRRIDVDLDVDLRLLLGRRQRARGVRILEGKILDVLGKNIELWRFVLRLPAVGRISHEMSSGHTLPQSAVWLTQPTPRDKNDGHAPFFLRFVYGRASGSCSHSCGSRSITAPGPVLRSCL